MTGDVDDKDDVLLLSEIWLSEPSLSRWKRRLHPFSSIDDNCEHFEVFGERRMTERFAI